MKKESAQVSQAEQAGRNSKNFPKPSNSRSLLARLTFPPGWSCSLSLSSQCGRMRNQARPHANVPPSAGMCTTSPTLMTSWCASVAMIPLAGSDKQHLIAAMDVHLVPRTGTEVDDGKIGVLLISGVSSSHRVTDRP